MAQSINNKTGGWLSSLAERSTELAVLVGNEIQAGFLGAMKKRNVLVLGDSSSGKTALQWYIRTGKPFRTSQGGTRQLPRGTHGVEDSKGRQAKKEGTWSAVGKRMFDQMRRAKIDGGICFLPRDVGGEFRAEWHDLMDYLNPELIIYMVDGRAHATIDGKDDLKQPIPSLKSVVYDVCDDVIIPYAQGKAHALKHLAIFLNYSDQWNAKKNKVICAKQRGLCQTTLAVAMLAKELDSAFNVDMISYHCIQLSPEENSWPQTQAALADVTKTLKWKK